MLPARRFGSVGLMIARPGVQITARSADTWSAEGPLAERALKFAKQVHRSLPQTARPQHLVVERVPNAHAGLGTGTQLALAVARAVAANSQLEGLGAVELAHRAGRGLRSGLGVHGFERGGLLVEGGKKYADGIAPLLARVEFPSQWRVLLMIPPWGKGLHGSEEAKLFDQLGDPSRSLRVTDSLCRLVLLGILPALAECDLRTFGEALYDFNLRGRGVRQRAGWLLRQPAHRRGSGISEKRRHLRRRPKLVGPNDLRDLRKRRRSQDDRGPGAGTLFARRRPSPDYAGM